MATEYHAKLYAHELTRQHSVADAEKLAGALMDAQVDLNPHQVEAALFAFKSPLAKGAILADEVGLGKTIEAGLLLAQKWTEGKRRILIVTPANLRKQWSQELAEKFYLPSMILEARNYNKMVKDGVRRPFEQKVLIICSFQFAARHAEELMVIPWDLVVIDEAHRLRNVYRPDNRIGKALKGALANVPKVLLTATPLQNSLMELYGLVSLIDDYAFGDAKSFRAQIRPPRGRQPLRRAQGQTETCVPPDAEAAGARIYPLHQQDSHHAGVRADRSGAKALRHGFGLSAAAFVAGPTVEPALADDAHHAQAARVIHLRDRRGA
jgi:SNF2 family DNA or RNA helicase